MSSIHELLKQVYPLKLRMELFNAIWTGWRADIKEKDQRIAEPEAKLAEKEKVIEKLNACVDFYKSYYISFNEKVIHELGRVKEKILPEISSYVKREFVVKEFDNQIKQLKGENQ